MDFNTILTRFGLDSSCFVNKPLNRIEINGGFIYEVEEEYKVRICPNCNHHKLLVHTYKWIEIKLSTSINLKEILRVKRIRYRCPKCGKTHTFELIGLSRNKIISPFVFASIKMEFQSLQSFSAIAKRYNVSVQEVINIFDDYTKLMPRLNLPEYLCIDEKHFEGDSDGKYCVILSNFDTGEVVDVIENRQMPYLDRYFSSISQRERNNVKVFISDMYDGYYHIKRKYFPNASFVVDLFHVVKLLTEAVKRLRIRTYNQYCFDDTIEKHFLKQNWKIFLCDQYKIRKNDYHSDKFDVTIPYGEIILRCLKLNQTFWDGYDILQELIHYDLYANYTDAQRFLNRIISKLNSTGDELLIKVADSYQKWQTGIITGMAKNQTGRRYSNATAENNNSHIQRVINIAYGYRNFKRFRSRIMLLLSYKNQR